MVSLHRVFYLHLSFENQRFGAEGRNYHEAIVSEML